METKKLSLKEKLFFGAGQGGNNIISTIIASFLMSYYTDTALMGAAAIGTMMLLCRIFDGFTDIVMGGIVDKTNTKIGKCRPWLFVVAPLMAIGIVLLFNVPVSASDSTKLIYVYLTYIFLNAIILTIFGISYYALLPRITTDPQDRVSAVAVMNFINAIMGIIAGSMTMPLILKYGWTTTSFVLGILAGVLVLITALGVKERTDLVETDTRKDKTSVKKELPYVLRNKYFYIVLLMAALLFVAIANGTAALIYYCNVIIGNPMLLSLLLGVFQLPGIFTNFFTPILVKKFGNRNTLITGGVFLAVGYSLYSLAGTNATVMMAATVIRVIGMAICIPLLSVCVANTVDYSEWKFGVRCEGLYSASLNVGQKIGLGLGGALTGVLLSIGGYVGGAEVQSASAIRAINFATGWAGAILAVLFIVVASFMNVEKYLPEILKSREAAK